MFGYDGPSLRSLRETHRVPLRRVARQAGMSHGHLSKVERGEPGRPVTPAVLTAYEKAIGVTLRGPAADGGQVQGWRRGQLSDARRRSLNARIAAVGFGATAGEPPVRMLENAGRPVRT